MMNFIESINQQLFLKINAGLDTNIDRIEFAMVCADYLLYLVPLLLICMWLWGNSDSKKVAMKSTLVAFSALALAQMIGFIYPHPRPFMIALGHTFIPHVADASFPSDHMTLFSAIAVTMFVAKHYVKAVILIVMSLLVAWARIFLGVHFPLDMVGAVMLSGLTLLIFKPLWRYIDNKIYPVFESKYRFIFSYLIQRGWVR